MAELFLGYVLNCDQMSTSSLNGPIRKNLKPRTDQHPTEYPSVKRLMNTQAQWAIEHDTVMCRLNHHALRIIPREILIHTNISDAFSDVLTTFYY
ncbi:hypothetical protein N7447_004734 [Penicillium robsamsonii]|uniref:uncharacterized protein n=1 Tax=Penicillium robsamsonii TaxID=1792511 RepID=UPI0025479597|nr:uncharacterized protein N7447_004734 [Penicillium robsamsonii]KAJ5822394.1 hypothetical protein N7447_004734 [Penicillium robsamsonii]